MQNGGRCCGLRRLPPPFTAVSKLLSDPKCALLLWSGGVIAWLTHSNKVVIPNGLYSKLRPAHQRHCYRHSSWVWWVAVRWRVTSHFSLGESRTEQGTECTWSVKWWSERHSLITWGTGGEGVEGSVLRSSMLYGLFFFTGVLNTSETLSSFLPWLSG